ncbi:MAG: carboxylesterase [Gammaproteobacteria bacterium]|nr:carboxylesterase [Gammaproteobacteria bacterium]
MSNASPALRIDPPARTVTASVIWLHGLGASGYDFEPIIPQFDRKIREQTRFIFPHAPRRSVTINMGMVMPAWYDIAGADLRATEDGEGIRESEQLLCEFIQREIDAGVTAERIILAGFSQGGAIALHTGLRYPQTLGGIMGLSTYLPLAGTLADEAHSANARTPIFMAHGLWDPVIPISHGEQSQKHLQHLGYPLKWLTYPMDHSVSLPEIVDIDLWLQTQILQYKEN